MTPAQARRMYLDVRRAFVARWPGAPAAHRRAPLVVARRACTVRGHCRARDLAYAVDGPRARVVLLARALDLPWQNVLGLMLHELGHLFDPAPGAPDAERRADAVAARATGLRVRYDARDIQTVGPGTSPRPRRLHR